MSNKAKYIGLTALCTSAAILAFLGVYSVFNSPARLFIGEDEYEIGASDGRNPSAVRETGESDEAAEPAAEVLSQPDKINSDTTIVYEYYYEDDNKIEKAEQKAPNSLQNLTREQLVSKIEGFSVESFSSGEVVLRKKITGSKTNRYVLGIWNGHVAVFYGGSGFIQSGLKEVTDTPVSSLSTEEQERLKDGIVINGDGSLMKVLEDYGS